MISQKNASIDRLFYHKILAFFLYDGYNGVRMKSVGETMKKYCGAVFTDIDGTLIDENQKIFYPTPKVKEAFVKLKEKGFLIGVATGRAKCYIPDLGIDFDCYVSCNGAVAEVNGKEFFHYTIPHNDLNEIIAFMDREKMGYILENSNQCLYDKKSHDEVMNILKVFHIDPQIFSPVASTKDVEVNQIMVLYDDEEKHRRLAERFGDQYAIPKHRGGLAADLGKKEINKASGIRAVLEAFQIDRENTYAFGDQNNDIQMLQEVAHGIAMTPHAESLTWIAEYFTTGVKQDGIYWGLKHYGLID